MPTIKSIVYKPENVRPAAGRSGYFRVPILEAVLQVNYGIEGDSKGGNPKRNLNVMDDVTLTELAAEGYPTDVGVLGENIILSGIDLRTLPVGTRLKLGDEAVIQIGAPRVPCGQLTELDARMPDTVRGRVGSLCRVITAGTIRAGDVVEVVPEVSGVTQPR